MWVFVCFFSNRRYSLTLLPQLLIRRLCQSPSVSRISWQTLQPITLCYCVFCTQRKFLFHIGRKRVQTLTRGKLHHTQTPALDRLATWTKKLWCYHPQIHNLFYLSYVLCISSDNLVMMKFKYWIEFFF